MPLLSGPPGGPDSNENACRKCNKEFNLLFARSRKCNHCGHLYCQSCTDYQALMPRQGDGNSGYDPVAVCAYCIENLTITAAGKGQLRNYSLAKLRKYAKDYNINVNGVIEKDDLIDKIIGARTPTRCLPPANEKYYRLHSIPHRTDRPRGVFARAMDAMGGAGTSPSPQQQQEPSYQPRQRTTSHPSSFPRPDLDDRPLPSRTPSQSNQAPPRPPPSQQRRQRSPDYYNHGYRNPGSQQHPPQNSYPYQPYTSQAPPPRPQYAPPPGPPPGQRAQPPPPPPRGPNLNVPPRPRSASTPRAESSRGASPAPAVPTLDELLEMAPEALGALSVSALKAVLFRNHVHAGVVVEKAELVAKVRALVEDERLERAAARRRQEEEDREHREAEDREDREMQEVLERSRREHEEQERRRTEQDGAPREEGTAQAEAEPAATSGVPTEPAASSASDAPATPAEGTKPAPKLTPKAQAMASHLERTGLCVVCQDEEANIAIVDCGHLAMCRACSDLIMGSTRECPLCRTRIVTEARLLRIFKA
ncbi:RING-finger domain-containing protein [Phanerochaete sordida]|uniref:RING-finger domain-containing protein n=1 Tax=Phanerochaete sordida TaxID=48140 RepID=A0A9P3L7Y3_9APHY|nr:RING-finger domain-containing protein [Phanerochaete sordida]